MLDFVYNFKFAMGCVLWMTLWCDTAVSIGGNSVAKLYKHFYFFHLSFWVTYVCLIIFVSFFSHLLNLFQWRFFVFVWQREQRCHLLLWMCKYGKKKACFLGSHEPRLFHSGVLPPRTAYNAWMRCMFWCMYQILFQSLHTYSPFCSW